MPRPLRRYIAGLSHHVIQRGNNRIAIFQHDVDREIFLELLRRAVSNLPVEVHAYVLMSNHFHLLVTATACDGIPQLMKRLDGAYVRYYNTQHQRIGTLWNGRYRGILIENEQYWLTCLRYIEQNPIRAGIVRTPEIYRWSSYHAHAGGHWPDWLTPHRIYQELGRTAEARQYAYRHIFGLPFADDQVQFLR